MYIVSMITTPPPGGLACFLDSWDSCLFPSNTTRAHHKALLKAYILLEMKALSRTPKSHYYSGELRGTTLPEVLARHFLSRI